MKVPENAANFLMPTKEGDGSVANQKQASVASRSMKVEDPVRLGVSMRANPMKTNMRKFRNTTSHTPVDREIMKKAKELRELKKNDEINTRRRLSELENFEKILDGERPLHFSSDAKKSGLKDSRMSTSGFDDADRSVFGEAGGASKQKQGKLNPVMQLSKALKQYKSERFGTEDDLIKCIEKVNLDKSILFREKQSVLWREEENQNQTSLEESLRKGK